jgi:hypothetical protein
MGKLKKFAFGFVLAFLLIYSFNIGTDGFGMTMTNESNETIRIIRIINDDKEIVPIDKKYTNEIFLLHAPNNINGTFRLEGPNLLSTGVFTPSTLIIVYKDDENTTKRASCQLKRNYTLYKFINLISEYSGDVDFQIRYAGNGKLICSNGWYSYWLYDGNEWQDYLKVIDYKQKD